MSRVVKSLVIAAFAMQSLVASADVLDLGVAGKFNVFVFGDFTSK